MSRASPFRKVTHVIFDMDGVLLDTEPVYANAIASISKRFGKTFTPEIQSKITGSVERDTARIAVTEMKLPISVDSFQTELRETAYKIFREKEVALMPGAAALVRHLYSHKIPIAIATSSSQNSFDLKSKYLKKFFSQFNHIVCSGIGCVPGVKEGKPKPDVFLLCASKFPEKPYPDKCLVFEDAPNGVKAAISAGMQVIMIPDKNVPKELQKDAQVVVTRIDQAPLGLFGLPALKRNVC